MRIFPLLLALITVTLIAVPLRAEDKYDQSKVPLEVDNHDPNKIVLIAGHRSHGPLEHEFFAGTVILVDLLKQNGISPVMVRDGWPKNEQVFEGAKAIVLYMDGGGGHPAITPEHMAIIQKYIDKGVGFVNLHYAVEYPADAAKKGPLAWLGGYYETNWSINPTWEAVFAQLPDHPITHGVSPFKIRDEWYYNMRWNEGMKNVTPILQATPPDSTRGTEEAKKHPGRIEIEAWAYDRADGGRSFGFTGGHYHHNWSNENFRRLVTNAILWSAKLDVPAGGAKVELDPEKVDRNLDKK